IGGTDALTIIADLIERVRRVPRLVHSVYHESGAGLRFGDLPARAGWLAERLRQVQRESATAPRRARKLNFTTEQAGDLAANSQAQPRPAILAARAPVGLLEGLKDDLLLIERNADSRVLARERKYRPGFAEGLLALNHPGVDCLHLDPYAAAPSELHRL